MTERDQWVFHLGLTPFPPTAELRRTTFAASLIEGLLELRPVEWVMGRIPGLPRLWHKGMVWADDQGESVMSLPLTYEQAHLLTDRCHDPNCPLDGPPEED